MMAYVEAQALLDRNDVPANVARAIDRLQTARGRPIRARVAALARLLMRYERTRDSGLIERATRPCRRCVSTRS